ncbi:uncharacterized protein [Periplaneta americana]|uniref:uncharacterized protein isoform X3 n=1 Tax=Periplaneta americana TaxID=6978 RepID=UPI0037E757A3
MSERSDEEASVGSDGQPIPNDLKYSSSEGSAKDKLYEPKKKRKIIRVLTVLAYVLSVSLAAIMLSLYYVFLWDPKIPNTERGAMALRDPEPFEVVRNISCFHFAPQGMPMKTENLSQQSQSSTAQPIISSQQPSINITADQYLDT